MPKPPLKKLLEDTELCYQRRDLKYPGAFEWHIPDCNGRRLNVGAYVAYNQSGNIQPGQITKVLPRWRTVTWHPGRQWTGSFRVLNLITKEISTVKRPESMMVIPTT